MSRFSKIMLALLLAVLLGCGALYFFRPAPDIKSPAVVDSAAAPVTETAADKPPKPSETKPTELRKPSSNSDIFDVIKGLAKGAFDGDGGAQYRISRELDRCEMTLSLVRKSEGDPESLIWALPDTGWSQPMKEGAIAELRRCRRFLKEDPFAELPPRKGGYDYRYWMQRAAESRYPPAVAEKALNDWSRASEGGTNGKKASIEVQDALTTAIASGNPEIALTIGFRLSAYESPDRKIAASALMLAACRLGADCSASSESVPFWMCYDPNYPNCNVDGNVELMVSNALSPGNYAEAYAQSQVVEEVLRNRDPAAIRKLLEKLL